MERQLVGRERADFAIRSLLWIGSGVLLAGLALRWLVGRMAIDGAFAGGGGGIANGVTLLVCLGGAALLGTGLVAVGAQLGLAAYGAPRDAEPGRDSPR